MLLLSFLFIYLFLLLLLLAIIVGIVYSWGCTRSGYLLLACCSICNSIQLLSLLFRRFLLLLVLVLHYIWQVFLSVSKSFNGCYSFSWFFHLSIATCKLPHLLNALAFVVPLPQIVRLRIVVQINQEKGNSTTIADLNECCLCRYGVFSLQVYLLLH